jgi:hypothetical protein
MAWTPAVPQYVPVILFDREHTHNIHDYLMADVFKPYHPYIQ